MIRFLMFAGALVLLFVGYVFYGAKTKPVQKPQGVQTREVDRLTRISPALKNYKNDPKPYLMLHLEDLKKCFPVLLSDARAEDLVTLENILVEAQKVFLPTKPNLKFHQLRFKDTRGQERVLRWTSERKEGAELFVINEQKEWQPSSLPPDLNGWPAPALFRHFNQGYNPIEEEKHQYQRGRAGEQISYKEKQEHIAELEIFSPSAKMRLSCTRRDPRAILCLCTQGARP